MKMKIKEKKVVDFTEMDSEQLITKLRKIEGTIDTTSKERKEIRGSLDALYTKFEETVNDRLIWIRLAGSNEWMLGRYTGYAEKQKKTDNLLRELNEITEEMRGRAKQLKAVEDESEKLYKERQGLRDKLGITDETR